MKISSARGPGKRSQAMNCLLVNQLATPGLGTLMGRRWLAGSVQLTLAVVGFLLIMGWFAQIGVGIYREFTGLAERPEAFSWLGKVGGILFLSSWLLAWFSSISLLREAPTNPEPAPPKLTDAPPARPRPPILKN